MTPFFNSNRLSLNIGKSGYMVVSKKSVERKSIQLNSGILKYKESHNYLGYELTDSGDIGKIINVTSISIDQIPKFL